MIDYIICILLVERKGERISKEKFTVKKKQTKKNYDIKKGTIRIILLTKGVLCFFQINLII